MNKTSNSKLSKEQKSKLKAFKSQHPQVQFFSFPNEGVTVVISPEFPGSKMANVTVSTMSQDEKKFRAKVGEYHAVFTASGIKVEIEEYSYFEFASDLAYTLTAYRDK